LEFFSWPVVVLVLGLVGMFVFRTPLAQLIGRTEKIGKDLLLAGPQKQSTEPANESSTVEEFLRSYDNRLLLEQEQAIRADIERRGLRDAPDLEKLLIRSLAGTQILAHFERVYSTIWDSQLALLRHLNGLDGGMERDAVGDYFQAVVDEHPVLGELQDVDGYLGFLQSNTLIAISDEVVAITVAGREFLKWLVEAGKPDRGVF
jgi:hypothetical protein